MENNKMMRERDYHIEKLKYKNFKFNFIISKKTQIFDDNNNNKGSQINIINTNNSAFTK